MSLPLIILLLVFALIAARKIGRFPVAIWQAMGLGALAVLATGQITPLEALHAVDWEVMLFLAGMFLLGQALVDSGYLYVTAYRLFSRLASVDALVLALLFTAGGASALLMNDTLAIVCTPLVLRLAREHGVSAKLLLFALAYAITIGSAMSPIGNPQNLLIALHGPVPDPFVSFARHLALPTLFNLCLAYVLLRLAFRREFHGRRLVHAPVALRDPALARTARLSVFIVMGLVLIKIVLVLARATWDLPMSAIAVLAALPLLAGRWRLRLVREMDWQTLTFFVAMFVLMGSVWQSGVLQGWISRAETPLTSTPAVLSVSALLSQLISNVPMTALYLPVLQHAGADLTALMVLAAGGTVAGNLLILGAASNVIIIQRAEREGASLGFLEFARLGLPLTLANLLVYWAWISWFG